MNLSIKNKLLKCLVVLLAISVLFTSAIFLVKAAEQNSGVTFEFEIEEEYVVGQDLTLPTCQISGKTAKSFVVYPNGAKKATGSVVFDQAGKYTVIYQAVVDGDLVEEELELFAYDKRYSSSSAIDKVEYQAQREFAIDKQGNTATTAGIYAELSEGASFKYNNAIDLSKATKNDKIFSCNIIATEPTYCDFWELTVRLTDAYDPFNYVDVILSHNGKTNHEEDVVMDSINYVRAGASNQIPAAFNSRENRYLFGSYGNYAYVSMMSDAKNGNALTDTFEIYFDYQEKVLYGPVKSMAGENMICDLDDPAFFGENLWDGFTTGECFISVFAKKYQTAKGGIFVTEIFGESAEDLAASTITDAPAPAIDVDFGDYEQTDLPFAVVGKEYNLFKASARNLNLYCSEVYTNVYFNYNSNLPSSFSVKDGKFTPTVPGVYTIEYKAYNGFGKESVKTIDIICVSNDNPIEILIGGERAVDATTGSNVKVADFNYKNQSGSVDVKISAVCGQNVYPIDLEQLSFTPLVSGEYDVVYTITDYAGQTDTDSYKINVVADSKPKFIDKIYLPKYFIAGYAQKLPELTAYDFSTDGKAIKADIYVKEGDAEERKIDGTIFTPILPPSGAQSYTLKIIYRATGENGVGEVYYEVPCYSIFKTSEKIARNKLFVLDENIERGYATIDYVDYAIYTTQASGANMTYINPIPANAFSFEYYMVEGKNGFDVLNLYLSDAVNGQTVKASVERKDAESLYFSVNDGVKVAVSGISFENFRNSINITFDNANKQFAVNFVNFFSVKLDAFGNPFNGFESGLIYLTVEFESVSSQSSIIVGKIANQQLLDYSVDNTEAMLSLNGVYKLNYDIGEILDLIDVVCVDMISPYITKSLTVYAPDGSVVTDVNSVKLKDVDIGGKYSIELKQYGQYRISYMIEGYDDTSDFFIEVVDRKAPDIKIKNTIYDIYSVGDSVSLSVSAKDNLSKNCKVFVCVEQADGTVYYSNSSDYVFSSKGNYRIIFNAMDERGNVAQKVFVVTVK